MTTTIAKEKPIIFTGHSPPAILDGRKWMTRRVIKPQPHECHNGDLMYKDRLIGSSVPERSWKHHTYEEAWEVCPYGKPGDRLWVRESFFCDDYRYPDAPHKELLRATEYRASHDCADWEAGCPCSDNAWQSPLFMPRWASRLTLEITEVRVERLQAITEEDAMADGGWLYADCPVHKNPVRSFAELWDKLNAKRGFAWESNPFCWAITFRRLEAP